MQNFISKCRKRKVNLFRTALNADSVLKDAVIKLFVDKFEVLATHPIQYSETEVL